MLLHAVSTNRIIIIGAGASGMMAAGRVGAQVVDIRDQEHFDTGHIVDSINIPTAELEKQADKKLKNSKSIIIVCDSGSRSIQAVAVLRRSGYDQSFSLQGGLAAWRNANLPVVTSS